MPWPRSSRFRSHRCLLEGLAASLPLLLSTLGCVTVWQGLVPQEPPATTESARRLASGVGSIVREDVTLVDSSRSTPALGGSKGSPERILETTVWYPEEAPGPRPLVVYSHGYLSERGEARYLAEHLASHGYVVVAADFPLSSRRATRDPTLLDLPQQPGDVSFLIDWLLERRAAPQPPGAGVAPVDPERIAAVGLSLGGLTSTLVAFHPRLRDPRVRAAVSIAGPVSFLTHRLFETAPVPLLMIASPDDAVVEFERNGATLLERAPTAALLTVHGASHTGFAGPARLFRFWPNPDVVGCWMLERHVDDAIGADALAGLGTPEVGVALGDAEPPSCRAPWWRRTLRPRRQHVITKLAVRAFLDAALGGTTEVRDAGRRYLTVSFAREIAEVELSGVLP
jgi:predicted dienelactone hydrolase